MTAATEEPASAAGPRQGASVAPFTAFGLVLLAAGSGALWEMAYYDGLPALFQAAIGTTLGIVVALTAFFVLGLKGPPNE
jgi:hypothetical protein